MKRENIITILLFIICLLIIFLLGIYNNYQEHRYENDFKIIYKNKCCVLDLR